MVLCSKTSLKNLILLWLIFSPNRAVIIGLQLQLPSQGCSERNLGVIHSNSFTNNISVLNANVNDKNIMNRLQKWRRLIRYFIFEMSKINICNCNYLLFAWFFICILLISSIFSDKFRRIRTDMNLGQIWTNIVNNTTFYYE